jgi:hypothetical protein
MSVVMKEIARDEQELRDTKRRNGRSWQRMDRYAIFDLGREHSLSSHARWMLAALCLIADFRTCAVRATIRELSEQTGIGLNTVPKALDELAKADLVNITSPFGPNREGEVEIIAWHDIVVEGGEPKTRIPRLSNRRQVADQPRTNRGPTADNSTNDQGEGQLRGEGGNEEELVSSQEERLFEEDWGSRQCGALSEVNWESDQGDALSATYAVVEPDEATASVHSMDDVALSSSEAVKVSPNPRCPDCGGWLEPPLPEGEDWCLCDWNGQ